MKPYASAGQTYAHRLIEAMRMFAADKALRHKVSGVWRDLTYAELEERVLDCAAGLRAHGVVHGDRVAIWLETSVPWIVADLAIQLLGAVTTTVYHTLPDVQARGILRDSGAKALVSTRARLAALAHGEIAVQVSVDAGEGALSFEALLADGRRARTADASVTPSLLSPHVAPEDLSAIIYTSGTTGEPKGAMLTHRNMLGNVDGGLSCFFRGRPERLLLHLPLAHVASRNTLLAYSLLAGQHLAIAEPEREKLPANLLEVAPVAFVTVPYLLDKFTSRVLASIDAKGAVMRALARRALALGKARRVDVLRGGPVLPPRLGIELSLLDRLVLRKIRARLGGALRYVVIGAAASTRASLELFWALGIDVYEGYGATEVTNLATCTWPGDMKLGTVGRAAPGMEVRLAPDGEVLVRGPNVMRGYWNRPEATREAIDAEGWYHSGDIGEMDAQGYLSIVDRKKEIFVLATGKKVAPQAVENALKRSACIAQACAIGHGRNYMTVLVVPDMTVVAGRLGGAPSADDARVSALLRDEMTKVSGELADFEQPKRLRIIPELTQENGMLTPTLKLRRKEIDATFAREIESLYEVR